jgi:3-hydroxybutyryl-CoA dehydrogenase
VIGSNTSPIPIAELAGKVQHAGRVVGIHFFSPVPAMKLIEIVVALDTAPETVEVAYRYAEKLGKHPIKTKDRSGFIVNFLLIGQLMAAMFEEGFATREDIDDGMRLGAGHPIGPLALADMVGLDVCDAVANSLFEEFKRDEYAAAAAQADDRRGKARAHVRSGFLRIHLGEAARQGNITRGHTHPPGGRT